MEKVTTLDIDPDELEAVVGSTFYGRGLDYARRNAVLRSRWSSRDNALHGKVLGRGEIYETSAYFESVDGLPYGFEHGECSCPIGFNCKHVAALVLATIGADQPPVTPGRRQAPATSAGRAAKPPSWEQSLGALLESPPAGASHRQETVPLAIELSLSSNARTPMLSARLVQPGRAGWVGGSLAWNKLGTLTYQGYRADQLRVLNEFYAVYRSHDQNSGYYYSDMKSIDLSGYRSSRLWPLLDEAEAVGIRLVHAKKALGDLAPYHTAELRLDVTEDTRPGSLVVTPALTVAGSTDVVLVRFIGANGHGLVCTERADVEASADPSLWRIRLARLATPAAPQLQRMVLAEQSLKIPAGQSSRFRDEYYPRLRHIAPVVSSDESFVPPEISAPTLTLNASYHDGHALELGWEWAYQIGESQVRAPLTPARPEDGFRDPERERAILAGLDFPAEQFGPALVDPASPDAPGGVLGGIDTMRFTTELLPLLTDLPDVAVEVSGSPADYREAGDSLSVSISTDDIAGETDWFDLGITISVEGKDVPFASVFAALATGQSHLLLDNGAYFSLEKPELQTLRQLIEEARALQDRVGDSLRISRYQVGLWDELASLGVVGRQAKAWKRQLAALRSIDSDERAKPPATLNAELRPYQLEGFQWLAFLWKFQLGGILADDMGLGKTLQSLALICHAKRADRNLAPFVIIAPTSVVSNWAAESARFAPELSVVTIGDTMRRRGSTLAETIAGADVVVTSHTLFRLDFDEYAELPWSGLIMDEAQFAKNHQSKIYQCARRLATSFKLAITGTPMENNLMELWSLLSITAPGLFPNPARFAEYYARPIEKQDDTDLLAQFRRRIKPLVKRRTKEQVAADLPAKQEQVLEVDLAPRHRKIYQTHLQRERQKVLGLIDDLNRNRFTILRSLTLLRQLSLHPGLIDEKHGNLPSAKIEALLEQMRDVVDGGHRALVFSQFTGFLDVVRRNLENAGVEYCYLDGKTRNRAAVVKKFRSGTAPVFLISLKAGGFGLNLTEADYCFLLDPWWNPATEAQAVDRTHRIGQTRNVMVYRLIAKDTIEEKVMELKARKAALFAGVMDDGNAFGGSLDADDIRGLFG
ncbi:helicase [Amycolatopsis balhimycina DSM 5908]|uniref:Helicase n=1 Tax=Amycolatopsis balhimycina DSM 5908 TaxID=1081091 RepID=A0A428WH99_AMYBA|nr:DEAD/DEAH box helicase [Amycolatopsis balhimycina]RSM42464.1 helicase [Amycolatopsis balhimycina DSM 5908]